jgi:hypothetical protein
MHVNILSLKDLPEISQVFYDSTKEEQIRNLKRGLPPQTDEEVKLSHEMTSKWFWSINNWYLNDLDHQHILFGVFEKEKLLAFVGARLDLPEEYKSGWVVSWLKSDPAFNIVSTGAITILWKYMFNYIEGLGKTQWHTLVEQGRHKAFDSFGKKLVSDIDDRYEYHTLCEIPRGTRSNIDWVYAMMGRQILDNKDYIVRTGTLKSSIAVFK